MGQDDDDKAIRDLIVNTFFIFIFGLGIYKAAELGQFIYHYVFDHVQWVP